CNRASCAAATQPVKCCQHHEHGGSSRPQHKPCDCNLDCEGSCAYVVPQKVRIDAPQVTALLSLAAAQPSLADFPSASVTRSELGQSFHGTAPPVRLHLLHQLLLI